MRNIKLKAVLQIAVVLSLLAAFLLCLNGCKKKQPDNTQSDPVQETSTETTVADDKDDELENTKPITPDNNTDTSVSTDPTENTYVDTCLHTLGNWIVDKPSTCTTEGSRFKECELCGRKVEEEVIPKTAHAAGMWIADKKTSCTAEGAQHQECTQCKKKIAHIIVTKADHKTKLIPGYAASASTPGMTDGYWCTTCGATVQEQYTIPIVGTEGFSYIPSEDRKTCTIAGFGDRTDDTLVFPREINGMTVTAIGESAFEGKTSIKNLYIPTTVTQIDAKAFQGCSQLANITYAGTTLEWNSLIKGLEWNANTGSYTVYCVNNSLAK